MGSNFMKHKAAFAQQTPTFKQEVIVFAMVEEPGVEVPRESV